jgi:hypothetical protein
VALALVFSSRNRKVITLADWANAAPNDVVATAAGELAGTTTSAGYGAPYNRAADGQKLGCASRSTARTTWSSPRSARLRVIPL